MEEIKTIGGYQLPRGADGGHYTPVVAQNSADTMTVEFHPSKAGMAAVAPVAIKLPVGSGNNSGQNANALTLTSPDGSVWDITITNEGVLTPVKRGGDAEPDEPDIPENPGNNVVEGRTLKITAASAPTADGRTLKFH